jgi:hypothetical protein
MAGKRERTSEPACLLADGSGAITDGRVEGARDVEQERLITDGVVPKFRCRVKERLEPMALLELPLLFLFNTACEQAYGAKMLTKYSWKE